MSWLFSWRIGFLKGCRRHCLCNHERFSFLGENLSKTVKPAINKTSVVPLNPSESMIQSGSFWFFHLSWSTVSFLGHLSLFDFGAPKQGQQKREWKDHQNKVFFSNAAISSAPFPVVIDQPKYHLWKNNTILKPFPIIQNWSRATPLWIQPVFFTPSTSSPDSNSVFKNQDRRYRQFGSKGSQVEPLIGRMNPFDFWSPKFWANINQAI